MISEYILWLFLAILVVLMAVECWKTYLNSTKLKSFHHIKGWPVVGMALNLLGRNNEQIFDTFVTKTDKLSYTWIGPKLVFHAMRPEDFQAILTSDKCLKKAFAYDFLYNRTGLLTSLPSIWKEHRRALNPTLGPKMVNSFLPILDEKSRKMANLMERQIDQNVDMHQIMFKASIDSILCASFGVNWTMQNKRGDEIHKLIIDITINLQKRIQRVWCWNPIYKLTEEYKIQIARFHQFYRFNRSVLETKRMELAEKMLAGEDELATVKENNQQNFLQKCLQMELEQNWTNENVCEEMDTIFIASIDTSATVLCGVTLMLAIHQEYQERVVDEMREIFANANETVTNDHLMRMTFLELVIKEAMRHFPVAPFIGRECTADLAIDGGIIPKGTQIFLNVLQMNKKSPYYGENVNEFYPERFLPENCANWHPYLYVPFSAGPRNCIGMRYAWASLKIALSHILRRFKLTTDLRMQDVIIKPELLLKFGNENAIRIERREWENENKFE